MAVSITVTGLTAQQRSDLADACETMMGPIPAGMTKVQFVTLITLRYWKNIVKSYRARGHEVAIVTEKNEVDSSFGDEVA